MWIIGSAIRVSCGKAPSSRCRPSWTSLHSGQLGPPASTNFHNPDSKLVSYIISCLTEPFACSYYPYFRRLSLTQWIPFQDPTKLKRAAYYDRNLRLRVAIRLRAPLQHTRIGLLTATHALPSPNPKNWNLPAELGLGKAVRAVRSAQIKV